MAGISAVAGAPLAVVLLLALGMFGFQASIGAVNDLVDAERDRVVQPHKPIPAGDISVRGARLVALAGALVGLAISAWAGSAVLVVAVIGLGSGYAYDLVARRVGLGWLAFAVALPALLAWAWLAAAGELPPGWVVLLPLAALAGPAVHLANSMADLDTDRHMGAASLATRLGRRRSRQLLLGLDAVIWILAWLSLVWLGTISATDLVVMSLATVLAAVGAGLSVWPRTASSDLGWLLAAMALAIMAVLWVAGVAAA